MARTFPGRVIGERAGIRSPWRISLWLLRRNWTAMAGLVILVLMGVLAAAAPAIAPHDPLAINPPRQLQPPGREFLLGTDLLGRDILSRLLYGGRTTLVIALFSVALSLVVGVGLGLVSGFYGGLTDSLIMRFVDMLLAFPRILLALCVVALLGTGLQNVMVAVGIAGISGYARVVRGAVLSAREEVYVEAARVVGCRSGRILFRHVLPNVMAPVIVLATLDVAHAILAASSLSFLGLGVQPPTPEWGLMLNEGRTYLRDAPWITSVPGLAIMLAVLCVNVLGDGLRDALDPRLRV